MKKQLFAAALVIPLSFILPPMAQSLTLSFDSTPYQNQQLNVLGVAILYFDGCDQSGISCDTPTCNQTKVVVSNQSLAKFSDAMKGLGVTAAAYGDTVKPTNCQSSFSLSSVDSSINCPLVDLSGKNDVNITVEADGTCTVKATPPPQ